MTNPNDLIQRKEVEKMIEEKIKMCKKQASDSLKHFGGMVICEQLLQELSQIESVNEWIPVSERLPDNGQSILVYLKPMEEGVEGDIKDARFFSDTFGKRFRVGAGEFVHGMYVEHKEYIQRDTDDLVYKVTHYMPLPPPPIINKV